MQFSIINYSETYREPNFRLESEFWTKPSKINPPFYSGEQITSFIQYGTSKALNESCDGYPILRLNEIDGNFIKTPIKYCNLISSDDYNKLRLKKGDIIICRTNGNPKLVGKSAVIMENTSYAFASYLYRMRPDLSLIKPTTLSIFFNSKFGRSEIERLLMVSNQANFSPAKFKEIRVPQFSSNFIDKIDILVLLSFTLIKNSKRIYKITTGLLYDELNLTNWSPIQQLGFTKNFSDTETAERFDAEYFQPKYDELVNHITQYSGGYDSLENLVNVKDENFTPDPNTSYKYIELANIGNNGEIIGFTEAIGSELPTRARRKVSSNDIIVSSIEGSLSSIALIEDSLDGVLCSTGFYVINSGFFNSETLLVLLKSVVGQLQLKKGSSGTILTAINKWELSKIILPKIDQNIQDEIKTKITEMYDSRGKSKQLIEIAKGGVEMAIEQDETAAENWINEEVEKLGVELNE